MVRECNTSCINLALASIQIEEIEESLIKGNVYQCVCRVQESTVFRATHSQEQDVSSTEEGGEGKASGPIEGMRAVSDGSWGLSGMQPAQGNPAGKSCWNK